MEMVNQVLGPMLKIPLLVGLIFIFVGLILRYSPPKKINWFYGYRTPRAMKSQARWDFAQKFSGMEMMRWGVVNVLVAFAGFWFKPDSEEANVIALIVITFAVISLFLRTEIALARKFEKT